MCLLQERKLGDLPIATELSDLGLNPNLTMFNLVIFQMGHINESEGKSMQYQNLVKSKGSFKLTKHHSFCTDPFSQKISVWVILNYF